MKIKLKYFIFIAILLVFIFSIILSGSRYGATWVGVDKSIVEKYASKYGRDARAPLINTDQGDLLLFLFTISGLISGFFIGYKWRELFPENNNLEQKIKEIENG